MSKQPKTTVPTDADLKGNPGIGTSKGMAGEAPEDVEADVADSTFEGDSESGTNALGGIDKAEADKGPKIGHDARHQARPEQRRAA